MTSKNEDQAGDSFIPLDEEIPQTEAKQKVINFNVNDKRIAEAKELYKDVDANKDMDEAKAAKQVLTKMRTTLAEAHKEQKAESLEYGRTLDAEKNRLLALIAEIEDPIKQQIDRIKNAEIEAEEERVSIISEHLTRLESYALDRHDLNVEQIKERRANLAKEPLTEDRYQELLPQAKMAHEESDTKLRIVLQRELDAEATKAEQDKIAEDNAAKQKELDERQAGLDAQAESQRREQEQAAEDAAAEQKKKDDARQAELDKQAEENAAEQRRLDDIKAEEDRKVKAAEEAAADLLRAPDRDKLLHFARSLEELLGDKPVMESQEGANTMLFIEGQVIELAETIRKCVEEMK